MYIYDTSSEKAVWVTGEQYVPILKDMKLVFINRQNKEIQNSDMA